MVDEMPCLLGLLWPQPSGVSGDSDGIPSHAETKRMPEQQQKVQMPRLPQAMDRTILLRSKYRFRNKHTFGAQNVYVLEPHMSCTEM